MINLSKVVIDSETKKRILTILDSGHLVQGKEVAKLEKKFTQLCKTNYALATNNGTSALHTALHSIGIKPDDEIITTPFTFVATANSILMVGAKPIFVDINEKTFNIDFRKIENKITTKTKAILVVNLFGQPADYNEINLIARKHKLLVVEDAAQSIGAKYKSKMSGNLADISCFSLYATKNIMSGEGGMITTNNKKYFKKAKLFRHHGQSEKRKYEYFDLGYNYRMMDLQAAMVLTQLKKLNLINKKRQKIASKYNTSFDKIEGLVIPFLEKNRSHVYHQYTIRVTSEFKLNRDEFKNYLYQKGIQSNIYYPKPLYLFKHLKGRNNSNDFPIANKISKEVLSIPVHPYLTNSDIKYIIKTIHNI